MWWDWDGVTVGLVQQTDMEAKAGAWWTHGSGKSTSHQALLPFLEEYYICSCERPTSWACLLTSRSNMIFKNMAEFKETICLNEVSSKILAADKSAGLNVAWMAQGKEKRSIWHQRQQMGRWSTYRGPASVSAEWIHSFSILLCIFSVPDPKDTSGNKSEMAPALWSIYCPSLFLNVFVTVPKLHSEKCTHYL